MLKHVDRDGSISVSRLEKRIRGANGTWQKLVSFDGVTWRLEKNQNKEALRLKRTANLHGKKWVQKKQKEFNARTNKGVRDDRPVLLPVSKTTSSILGKAKGKNQKYRRNLRRKREPNVLIAKLVHHHTCHGDHHPDRRGSKFVCSCPHPKKRRYCGNDRCMYDQLKEILK